MKKVYLIVLIFFVGLFSCSPEKYTINIEHQKVVIESGMTIENVKMLLGEKYEEQPDKEMNCERLIYTDDNGKKIKIRFKNKKLQSVF